MGSAAHAYGLLGFRPSKQRKFFTEGRRQKDLFRQFSLPKNPGIIICIFNFVIGVWAFVIKKMQFNMYFFLHLPKAG